VNMRLAISFAGVQISYFLDLQIKNYGVRKVLEKFGQGGHVLEPMRKS
jgi:hypothetical protein